MDENEIDANAEEMISDIMKTLSSLRNKCRYQLQQKEKRQKDKALEDIIRKASNIDKLCKCSIPTCRNTNIHCKIWFMTCQHRLCSDCYTKHQVIENGTLYVKCPICVKNCTIIKT